MQIEFTLADGSACWRGGVRPGGEGRVWEMAFARVLRPAGCEANMAAGTTWPPRARQALGLSRHHAEKPGAHPSAPQSVPTGLSLSLDITLREDV